MKTYLMYLMFFCVPCLLFSQQSMLTETINGTYHLLESERGVGNKQTKTKIFQYGLFGDTKVVAIAACAKCMPAIYKYQETESEELNIPVFYNTAGLFLVSYDSDSFVMISPSGKENSDLTNFSFSNFYSKNEAKVTAMTQQKIKEYIIRIAE